MASSEPQGELPEGRDLSVLLSVVFPVLSRGLGAEVIQDVLPLQLTSFFKATCAKPTPQAGEGLIRVLPQCPVHTVTAPRATHYINCSRAPPTVVWASEVGKPRSIRLQPPCLGNARCVPAVC